MQKIVFKAESGGFWGFLVTVFFAKRPNLMHFRISASFRLVDLCAFPFAVHSINMPILILSVGRFLCFKNVALIKTHIFIISETRN